MTGKIIRPDSLRALLMTGLSALVLAGCGGSEEGFIEAPPTDPASEQTFDVQLSGSVGDGPIVNANIVVTASTGDVLATFSSDQEASYNVQFTTRGTHYPLSIQADGGIDLVTNAAPDLTLESVLTEPSARASSNLSPFSTLAVATARQMNGGLSSGTLAVAIDTVMSEFSFGLTSLANEDVVSAPIDDSNLAQMIKASEALTEAFRRTHAVMLTADGQSSVDGVIEALGADLADGRFDGKGGQLADAHVSAAAALVSSQVLIESMANRLRVNDRVVTQTLDAVIDQLSDAAVTAPTESLPVTEEMLANAKLGVAAALAISPSAQLETVREALNDLSAGMAAANVRNVLPAGAETMLDVSITRIASGLEADIETVNAVRSGQGVPRTGNAPPTISGTPPIQAVAGKPYTFTPTASDVDDDPLTFSISSKPAWATFDGSTGTLAGTPGTADAGTFEDIVISVSDGTESASLDAFSITVEQPDPANSRPTISGTPPTQVVAGEAYAFTPSASDADGDALTFSITGKPAWATFDGASGRLAGTPTDADVGTYDDIVISVSDGEATDSLPAFSIGVDAIALGSVTLNWTPPTRNTDGSALTDLAGYTLSWGRQSGNYTNSADVGAGMTSFVVENLSAGTWYFAMSAYNTAGVHSDYSGEASSTVE
jgi:hypothetical protein